MLGKEHARTFKKILWSNDADLHTLAFCDLEFVNTLRGHMRGRLIDPWRAHQAFDQYRRMPLRRHGHFSMLHRVFALRDNLTAYDACYLALAERLDAPLLTSDGRLARAARVHSDVSILP